MFCPNCGSKMEQKFCAHCGYMHNGYFIEKDKKKDDTLFSYYFGPQLDYYTRNQNWYITGLLGPVYIISHKFYILGFILLFLDIIITLGIMVINHMFLFTYMIRFLNIVIIILNRFLWAAMGNSIYLKHLYKRLYKEKIKSPDHYKERIQEYFHIDNMFIRTKYIVYSIIGIILFLVIREIVYSYLLIS